MQVPYGNIAEFGIQITKEQLPEGLFFVATTNNGVINIVGKARSELLAVALCLQNVADFLKQEDRNVKELAYEAGRS